MGGVNLTAEQMHSLESHLKLIEEANRLASEQCGTRKDHGVPCPEQDVADQAQIKSLLQELHSQSPGEAWRAKAKNVVDTHKQQLEMHISSCDQSTTGVCSKSNIALDKASVEKDREQLMMIAGQPVQSQPVARND